jgi:Gpi18-like mannosyltransferase
LQFDKREIAILAGMLGLALAIRLLLFPLQGYRSDLGTYAAWFNTAAQSGPRLFYTNVGWCDYPPFNVYIFWAFGSLAKSLNYFGTPAIDYVIKIIPNIFDLAISAVIFLFTRKQLSFKLSLLAAALYVFNPSVIFNSAIWGQFDAIYTFFILLSLVLALKSKPELAAAVFAIGLLTKPQAVALLPLIAFLIFKKNGVKKLLFSVATFAATIFLVILPMEWSNPVTFLSNIYFGAYSGYNFTSVNAFNLWALYGLWVNDGNLFIVGWALFGALTVFALFVLNKRWKLSNEMLAVYVAFMLLFGFFMLPTRIHERYLFPAISMLALMFPFFKKTRALYVVLTATFLANIADILYWLNLYANAGYNYGPNLSGDPFVLGVSLVNVITFLYGILLLWNELKGKAVLKTEPLTIDKQNRKEQTHVETQL